MLVDVAKKYTWVRETKDNNIGKEIQMFQTATWLQPAAWAWCAAFGCFVLREALQNQEYFKYINSRYYNAENYEKWRCKDASAFGWIKWAKNLQPKHKDRIILNETDTAKRNDIVIYDFSHFAFVIENQIKPQYTLHTIEGNTNPKTAQRDGTADGVYEMFRKPVLVKNYIRL